ncbi:CPBP family intramembrane glutamic endopeptidase [Ruminiclostridium josui]|uniref:CPBP family intramembrane glutamic endopeptidase n=2 Tax=Ruminiclostridium josui TaxID=1499 RepID=UPI000463F271|nr:CPBP family intramembrane glutamic endopeptidase [Ruminiclostridium josui]
MNIHILCHSLLVLLATVYPVSIPQIALNFTRGYPRKNQQILYLMNCVIVSSALLLLSLILIPMHGKIVIMSEFIWYIMAIISAPVLIAIELAVGGIMLRLLKIKVKGISINANWSRISVFGCILTVLLAIIEELIYRQLWSTVIIDNLNWGIGAFVFISSVVYGLNHLYYGFTTFLQKTISGIIFAVIFLLSGGCILVPLIAHSLQNIIILIMGRCKKNG